MTDQPTYLPTRQPTMNQLPTLVSTNVGNLYPTNQPTLHQAGQAKQEGAVKLLVAAGADRTIRNNKGKTAHERAVEQVKIAIAELIA